MVTATFIPDDPRRATFFARLPERLDDADRQRKYGGPLTSMIRAAGIAASLRGFSQAGEAGEIAWVGIEVIFDAGDVALNAAFVAESLIELGASLESMVEVETEKGCVEFSLAEAAGR